MIKTKQTAERAWFVFTREPYRDPPAPWERLPEVYQTKVEAQARAIRERRAGIMARVVPAMIPRLDIG